VRINGATNVTGVQTSPPTERVVRVVQFLAARPSEPSTLAEVARSLALNKATCLAVLTQLVDAGWVIRDPRAKTYSLGGAFVALGRAAEQAFPAARHARIALEELSARWHLPCVIAAPQGEQITIIGCAGDPDRLDGSNRLGQQVPFAPPFGVAFVAWGPDDAIDSWYARSSSPLSDDDRAWFASVFTSVRSHGYGVERLTEPVLRLRHLLADVADDPMAATVRPSLLRLIGQLGTRLQIVDELQPGSSFPVNVVYVPVFDAQARPALNLSLHLLRDEITFEEVDAMAQELRTVANEITARSGGRLP
jgi:DNA-binding IclR family transcriptional regulator